METKLFFQPKKEVPLGLHWGNQDMVLERDWQVHDSAVQQKQDLAHFTNTQSQIKMLYYLALRQIYDRKYIATLKLNFVACLP